MMMKLVVLSFICWTSIMAQITAPSCNVLLNQGDPYPYDSKTIAGVVQTFCSVKDNVSECMFNNIEQLKTSNNADDWALGVVFDGRGFDANAKRVCDTLPAVALDLECLRININSSIACLSTTAASFSFIHNEYLAGNITYYLAKIAICSQIASVTRCQNAQASTCSNVTKKFMDDYNNIYSQSCSSTIALAYLPEWIRDSAFVACALKTYPDIVNDMVKQISQPVEYGINFTSPDSIINYIMSFMSDMCLKTDAFSNCVVDRTKGTTNRLDIMILEFTNVNNLKKALNLQCPLIADIIDIMSNTECMAKNAFAQQAAMCFGIYMPGLFNTTSTTSEVSNSNNTGMGVASQEFDISVYKDSICRGLKGMLDCAYIPMSRCTSNSNFVQKNIEIMDLLMPDSCKALSDQGVPGVATNPMASVFLQCGMPLNDSMSKVFAMYRDPTTQQISDMVARCMDIACRDAEWYLSCVDGRLSTSRNYVDIFFKELVDIPDVAIRKHIMSLLCTKHSQEIKNSLNCIMSNFARNTTWIRESENHVVAVSSEPEIFKCVSKVANLSIWNVLSNPAQILMFMDGRSIRSKFCRPIDGMIKCAKDYFGPCNANLVPLMETIPKVVLRTDCGGVKLELSTTEGPIVATKGPIGAATTYKLISIWERLLITFITIGFFLM